MEEFKPAVQRQDDSYALGLSDDGEKVLTHDVVWKRELPAAATEIFAQ
jgi:hypothetical protein